MSVTVPGEQITYVPTTNAGAALIAAMSPWVQTNDFAIYLDAMGACLEQMFNLVQDVGLDDGSEPTVGTYQNGSLVTTGFQPGYGALFNPQVASGSQLSYLGQFVGVQVPIGASDTTARSLVVAESGISRGTDAAVIAAAKRTLAGTQTVYYYPRTYSDGSPDAGWAGLVVLASECASLAATQAAVNAVRLSGVQMWFNTITGWTIGAMETAEATIGGMETAFRTVGGMEGDIPGA